MDQQIKVLVCSANAINIMKALDTVRPNGKDAIFKAFPCLSTARMVDLMTRIHFDVVIVEDTMSDYLRWPNIVFKYNNEISEAKMLEDNKTASFYLYTADQAEKATLEAIASGFKDTFIKPFDLLLFQQKLKYDLKSLGSNLGNQIYCFSLSEAGEYSNRMDLVELSESHAVYISHQPVTVGNHIKVSSISIDSCGGSSQVSEVMSCDQEKDGSYRVKVVFRGVSPDFTRAVRLTAQREHVSKKTL